MAKSSSAAPSPSLPDKIPDAEILEMVASWQVARLRAMLSWAENDKRTAFGWKSDVVNDAPTEAVGRMLRYEEDLAHCKPCTVEGARVLLRVARDILGHRVIDPAATMSQGPVLEIICAVYEALGYGAGETELRSPHEI